VSDLIARFWGVRGSIPTPGRATEKYGGNTTCIELRCGDTIFVFDAGSGVCDLSRALLKEFDGRPLEATFFFTHLHWDHIQGFPFFSPAFQPQNKLFIYGDEHGDQSLKDLLGGTMHGYYFPITIAAMQAQLVFLTTSAEFEVGPARVKTFTLPHPGGCLGYRVESGGSVFVLATDCELDQRAANRDELKRSPEAKRSYAPELLEFFSGADLLIIDAQYTDEDYQGKADWGHNSMAAVVDLCTQVRPHMVALFHHDPTSNDRKVTAIVAETNRRLKQRGVKSVLVTGAREGLTVRVQKPKPPLPVRMRL
jgi:phosphoribosyl 1,2-cyclic phosphodiesterase